MNIGLVRAVPGDAMKEFPKALEPRRNKRQGNGIVVYSGRG